MIKGLGSDMDALRLGNGAAGDEPQIVYRLYRFAAKPFEASVEIGSGENGFCTVSFIGLGKLEMHGGISLDDLDQLILDLQNIARCARQLSNGAADKDDAVWPVVRIPLRPYTLDEIKALPVGAQMYCETHGRYGEFFSAEKRSEGHIRIITSDGGMLLDINIDLTDPYIRRFWPRLPTPMDCEALPWEEQNRMLALDEVRALPTGARVWVEPRDHFSGKTGWFQRTDFDNDPVLLGGNSTGHFCICDDCSKMYYERRLRCWSNGEPTADESAAVPWKDE